MKKVLGFAALALAIVLLPTSSVQALTFIHEGVANGTLDAVPFGDSAFTITAVGDVRSSYSSGWFMDHTAASIAIDGLGSFDFITGTRTFVNNNSEIVGFSRAGSSGSDLFNGPTNSVFSTWDMLSGIGPVSGTGSVLQWANDPQIVTTGGILILNGVLGHQPHSRPSSLSPALVRYYFLQSVRYLGAGAQLWPVALITEYGDCAPADSSLRENLTHSQGD